MSAKPATIPTWSTSATGIARTANPGAPVRADGFDVDDMPPAGWINWLLNTIGLWLQYLSDQDFDGDVLADRFITPDSDVVHGLRTYVVGPFQFVETFSPSTATRGGTGPGGGCYFVPAGSFGEFFVPIDLQLGQRLKEVRIYAETDNGAAADISARISKTTANQADVTGTQAYLALAQNLPGPGTDVQLTIMTAGLPYTITAGECFELRVNISNTGGGVGKRVYRVEYDTDRVP